MSREYRHLDKTMDADHLPTPDPASPCGFLVRAMGVRCGRSENDPDGWHDRLSDEPTHPHVPTRCTCGHQLEAVNAR